MKWTTATALFLAIAAGGVGVTAVLNRKPAEPDQVLKEVLAERDDLAFDRSSAVERLTGAIEAVSRAVEGAKVDYDKEGNELVNSQAEEDKALLKSLWRARADIYRELNFYSEARSDLELINASSTEDDRDLQLEMTRLMALDGQPEEALSRLRPFTNDGQDFGEGWALQAQLEVSLAEAGLKAAFDEAGANLASSDAERVQGVIRELAARAADDRKREALITELSQAFYGGSEATSSAILGMLTPVRFKFGEARTHYANALNSLIRPEIVISLGQLLEQAGQMELALKLYRAARNLPEVARDPDVMAAFLGELLATNRIFEGVRALRNWDYKLGGSLEFYRSAGEVFYRAGEYASLREAANGLFDYGGDRGRDWVRFFRAVPYVAQRTLAKARGRDAERTEDEREAARKAMEDTIAALRKFANEEDSPEPFVGARDLSWFWLADAYAVLGDDIGELSALGRGLSALPERSSDDWIRKATLLKKREKIAWRQVETAYSHALNLDPARTSELASDWYEAGNQILRARGESIDDLISQIQRAGFSALNPGSIGPSVLTQIAGHQLAIDEPNDAIRAAEAARETFRKLVPPLDVIIRARFSLTTMRPPREAIIERIESAGIDDQVESFMAQLPDGRLSGEELVRAIRAAPLRFGKAAVARYYLTLDDPAKAGEALVDLADASAPPELKLLRANLLVEGANYTKALKELKGLEKDPRLRSDTLLMRLEALIGAGRIDDLDSVAAQMRTHPRPANKKEAAATLEAQLKAVDRLASAGRLDLALKNIDVLDTQAATRTADFYRRRVLIDAFTVDSEGPSVARESILRAEPYLRDGTPEMAAIALSTAERDWTRLPDLVDALLASNFKPSAKQDAALALLGERLESGSRAASEGLSRSPRDPDWSFLSAVAASLVDARIQLPEWFGPDAARDADRLLRGRVGATPKDPRDAVVLYLMSSRAEWSPWVVPKIAEIARETRSSLWTQWLLSRVLQSAGKPIESAAVASRLTEAHPRFGPGHDLAVRLAERQHPAEPLHPQVARTRRIRLQSLGEELIADPIEIRLARAGELARKGKNVEAILELAPVVNSGGIAATEGRLTLGLLMIRAKEYSGAAQQLNAALARDPGIFKDVIIDSLLFSLREAIAIARDPSRDSTPQRGELGEDAALAMLDELQEKFPLDPMVALAHLELEPLLTSAERGIRGGKVLRRLFLESGRKPLDQLRRGCTRRWIEFLTPIAPDIADEILRRDLVLEPGNLDLWQLSGEVAEYRNDRERSKSFYETLMAIDPRPDTMFALAEIMIEEGANPRAAKVLLIQAARKAGGGSARAIYLQTIADLRDRYLDFKNKNAPKLAVIVPRLRELWKSRERIRNEVDSLELGMLYADSLFRRLGAIENETEQAKASREEESAEAAIETDDDRKAAKERVAFYREALTDLRTLLTDLETIVEIDPSGFYHRDVITAMQGILTAIENKPRTQAP